MTLTCETIPVGFADPDHPDFIPRHLRRAWTDDLGHLHVRAIDDEDTTYLTERDQQHLFLMSELEEHERRAFAVLRQHNRANDPAMLDWWHTYIANHRPATATATATTTTNIATTSES